MEIHVHGEVRYIPVMTITLQKGPEGETEPFHCLSCGNTTNIIGGHVTRIYPVLEPSNQIPVVSTCKSCKTKYVFQDSGVETSDYIKVVLKPSSQRQDFFCYLGGGDSKGLNRIIEYENGRIYSYLEGRYVDIPYTSPCTNSDCKLVYQFNQLN